MVGGVNDSRRASQFPRWRPRGCYSGIPREPDSHTPKHMITALICGETPALTDPSQPGWPEPTGRATLPHVCAAGHAFHMPRRGDAETGAIFPSVAADE